MESKGHINPNSKMQTKAHVYASNNMHAKTSLYCECSLGGLRIRFFSVKSEQICYLIIVDRMAFLPHHVLCCFAIGQCFGVLLKRYIRFF